MILNMTGEQSSAAQVLRVHEGGATAAQTRNSDSEETQQCSPPTAEGSAPADLGEEDPEMEQWLVRTLQKVQPGAELTKDSIKALTSLLDGITQRILEEAKHISAGTGPDRPTGEAVPPEGASGGSGTSSSASSKPLTSLDIHKALKRVLPGDPSETRLRPYLPAVTKQAWHLDKQSLKGVKKLKTATSGGAAGPDMLPSRAQQQPGKENAAAAAGSAACQQDMVT